MRHAILCLLISVGWVLATSPEIGAESREAVPLRIVSKTSGESLFGSGLRQPSAKVTLSLRNDSGKIITAWKLSCLHAEGDGNFAVASVEEDAFFQYERGIPDDSHLDGPVEPGAVREIVFPRNQEAAAAPFAATSCGVDAVVFADRSHAGVSSVVDRIFEDRARMAADGLRAIDVLNRMIEGQGFAGDGSLPEVNRYAEAVREAGLSARAGQPARLGELVAQLQDQVDVVGKHLPRPWRERDAARKESGQ